MNGQFQNPFESIESAHDFFRLLSEEVLEAKQEIDADLQRESSSAVFSATGCFRRSRLLWPGKA